MSQVSPEIAAAASRGWRLLPCAPRDKMPLLKNWPTLATHNLSTIERWSARWPGANWGVAHGRESGTFVLDIDGQNGAESLATLELAHDPLPRTLFCSTARGRHFWLRYPAHLRIGNTAGKLGPGIDTRGQDGYSLIPPSLHPNGIQYRWSDFSQTVAPAPEWLTRLLTASEPVNSRPDARSEILTEGRRNDGLMKIAGSMRRRGADRDAIEGALLETNRRRCLPPLHDSEVHTIAQSAAAYAIGGPDVLQAAVEAIEGQVCRSRTDRFRALCAALQRLRGSEAVVLPVERIAAAFSCHWTLIARLRRQAVTDGWLIPERRAIAHRQAARFRVLSETGDRGMYHENENEANEANSGYVLRSSDTSLSDTPRSSETRLSETGAGSVSFPQCPACGSFFLYRQSNRGAYECETCGLAEIDESAARRMLPLDANIFNARVQ